MKSTTLPFLALLAAPLALGLRLAADEVAFKPAANAKSAKTLTIDAEASVTDASFTMNGEPMPPEALESIKSQNLIANMVIGATDTYVQSKDGHPIDLLRTFDKLKLSAETGDETHEVEKFKKLEGKSVRFKWNDTDKAYTKSFHESKGDDKELEQLSDDMDVRVLLPQKKVASGDTWDVPAEGLQPFFFPGGFMGGGADDSEEKFQDIAKNLEEQFHSSMKDFKVVCTYKGAHADGGVQVGEIHFTYDGKCKMNLSDMLEKIAKAQGGEEMPKMDITATAGMDLKGEGTLMWDLSAGLLHSYAMKAELGLDVDIGIKAREGDQDIDLSMSGAVSGKVEWDMKSER